MANPWENKMTREILGRGIYSFSEAAKFAHVNVQRMRAWFRGWPARPRPIIDFPEGTHVPGSNTISFLDLIDSVVVARLRECGVSMQYLRKVHLALRDVLSVSHPFAYKNLLTDGKRVFLELADEYGEKDLKELLTRQRAFPAILRDYLKQIEYDPRTLVATRWRLHERIVIDPRREFGKPIVDAAGIPTGVIAVAYQANGMDCDLVADWYGVSPSDVMAAVEFEQHLWGKAA
jgi:uncharacterized protein (DUF433 family)